VGNRLLVLLRIGNCIVHSRFRGLHHIYSLIKQIRSKCTIPDMLVGTPCLIPISHLRLWVHALSAWLLRQIRVCVSVSLVLCLILGLVRKWIYIAHSFVVTDSSEIRHRAMITVRVFGAETKPWRSLIKDNHEVGKVVLRIAINMEQTSSYHSVINASIVLGTV
jgi:hypothetical protein